LNLVDAQEHLAQELADKRRATESTAERLARTQLEVGSKMCIVAVAVVDDNTHVYDVFV
jgi:porphobilinogen deaminase